MERFAIFVDVGHVQAIAKGLHGDGATINVPHLTRDLAVHFFLWLGNNGVGAVTPSKHLRSYWYDAAPEGVPTEEQKTIGRLPNVKVRLGRLVSRRQKGVDALIMRDLMTLARERAMSWAFLVSGDGDLREGVVAVQDMGVQVVLVGCEYEAAQTGQADSLIRECDAHLLLPPNWWRAHLVAPPPAAAAPPPAVPAAADGA